MSADAKIWQDESWWKGIHDGVCYFEHEDLSLATVIAGVNACMDCELAWEFRIYPEGLAGLVGYVTGGGALRTKKEG